MKKPAIAKPAAGFTLVELLVVIVIMLVLVGLGAAVFGQVRTKAQLTSSVSNVRDLGIRVESYSQDNAGLLPVYKDSSQDLYWWGTLVKDHKNESELGIFKSPGDKLFDVNKVETTVSYGWNGHVCGMSEDGSGGEGPKRKIAFKNPSQILVLTESPKKGGQGLFDKSHTPDPDRYKGKAAALMLDGSAKALVIESEFKADSAWFMTEKERDARGLN
ncbi:prepilin-type N-terminal cleavage/methylation domain-containing protein [Luteolibacter sp. Populi]|uniref:prepilin-type N-terminal cleavage/methylation domain-containing protein n=1 Tax=Luteolibacter sp. Populi TaxID=3230487 RepID=UPI0034662111